MSEQDGVHGPIRVFLVDDHPAVRAGVRAYLAKHAFAVVGEAAGAHEALRKIRKSAPDIVLLDVNLPGIDGGELARRLRQLLPLIRLIAFSIHSSEAYVSKMIRCGVRGYVNKDQPPLDLVEAIRVVHRGGRYFPAGLTAL